MRKLIKQMKENHSFIETWFFTGEFDKALNYIEREEELIKNFQGDLPEDIKLFHTSWLFHRSIIYAYRGNLALSFKDAKELLRVAQLYDQKRGISDGSLELGRYYWFSGDLDKALVHMDRAIRLSEDGAVNDFRGFVRMAVQLMGASLVSIEKEDLERAKKYFKRLEELRELKTKEVHYYMNNTYQLVKSRLLQSSMRSRDRVMAEDLFREIIEEESVAFFYKLEALHGLCELFLIELRISNDINIIGEIKPLLEKLIGMAQKSGLNYYLIEAYILHGKLALVMFDIESSRRYLTQARRMAERFGYIILADEIKGLYEGMMVKIDTWEQMEKKDAPISERMELARLNDHLKGRFRTRIMKMERVTEGEVTVYKGSQICLVCKGSAGGFNFYICPTCNSVYCKECTQAVIDLENQCWSCNSHIDISKPVKPYKPEIVGDRTSKKPNKY
jgi:tetratricopeptide (TPR) repeat protein